MFIGKDDRVRFDVFADRPGELHRFDLGVGRFAVGDEIEIGDVEAMNVLILDKKAAGDLFVFERVP